MDDRKVPPAERPLRKSVSFCLPDDDEGDDDTTIPDRLLQHVRQPVQSLLQTRPRKERASSAQPIPTPSPPSDKDLSRIRSHRPLRRSFSVPLGLSLTNVLTRNLSAGLSERDTRTRRYSSSSVVKRRMMKHAEAEFNKVAAKVNDFCQRVDQRTSPSRQDTEVNQEPTNMTRNHSSSVDRTSTGQNTITHRGRRYRPSVSLSSNSVDEVTDLRNGGITKVLPKVTRDINSNDHMAESNPRQSALTEREMSGVNGYDNDDDDSSELNERISKWLDEVNNSVAGLSLKLDDEEDASDITIIPLQSNYMLGQR